MRFVKVIFSTLIVLLGIVFIVENLDMLKNTVRIRWTFILLPSRVLTCTFGLSFFSAFFWGCSPPPLRHL